MSDYQGDVPTIILKKTNKQIEKDKYLRGSSRMENAKETQERQSYQANHSIKVLPTSTFKKLEETNDAGNIPKVSLELSKIIQTARMNLKLSQKELAIKVNEKSNIINEYEAGKAIPNNQVLGKLESVLKVKLRGKNIGTVKCLS
jgi:ribosome-binding protein aMBF1 (putative translation factor)